MARCACGGELYAYETKARGPRTASACLSCLNKKRRDVYDPVAERDRSLRRRYGISAEEFDSLLAKQGGGCAACGTTEPRGKAWHVDHDHACCPTRARSCGKCIRGILCHGCNTALGNVEDDVRRLQLLIDYLNNTAVMVNG